MFNISNQQYPAPAAGSRAIVIAVLFGVFIGLFLIFFEPFDLNLSTYANKTATLFFFGIISTLVLVIFLYILPVLLPTIFSDKHWTVRHQILFYLAILFSIATLNGLYTNYINSLEFSWRNYWWIINRTFILGGIPISFLTVLDYNRKLNRHFKDAQSINQKPESSDQNSAKQVWQIATDLKDEVFALDENDFLYAEAIGNYIELYTLTADKVKKATFRLTLSSFEQQLTSNHLKRCHRSYLVNLKQVEHVSGNAQGLKLRLIELTEPIPVSRKYIPIIKKHLT